MIVVPIAVRVRHAIAEEKRAETGIITSSKTDTRSYRITVKNLHERAIPVTVIDQIPVSQNNDIKIELLGKTAPTKRDMEDKRGLLAWEMELKPDEEKTVEFGYRVSWPDQQIIHGTLSTIAKKARAAKLTRTALVIVGPVLTAHDFRDSALYDAGHEHVLRNRKTNKNR